MPAVFCGHFLLKVVVKDVLRRDAKRIQHSYRRRSHHRRTAEIVLHVLRILVALQVFVVEYLVDEALRSLPVVFRECIRQCKMEAEVRIFLLYLSEILKIEGFPRRSGSVPVADLAGRMELLEQIEYVRAQRGHSGSAADEHYFAVAVVLQEKLAVRA